MPSRAHSAIFAVVAGLSAASTVAAQTAALQVTPYSPAECPSCEEWNASTAPRHLFGNTYYVGTRGLSAVLITSDAGHILIDAGLPASAPLVMANIRTLGFRVEDIRLIVTTHAHFDHVGGVAALQRASGAPVAASPWSAAVLRGGRSIPGDPQYGIALDFPAVANVRGIADGDSLRVGPIAVVAHFTPGHTPGGTTWTWRACETSRCLDFVDADSQTPVSGDDFEFSKHPELLEQFAHGLTVIASLPCDVLLTPHPGASRFWQRLDARDAGDSTALRDTRACARYASESHGRLDRRVAAELAAHTPHPPPTR